MNKSDTKASTKKIPFLCTTLRRCTFAQVSRCSLEATKIATCEYRKDSVMRCAKGSSWETMEGKGLKIICINYIRDECVFLLSVYLTSPSLHVALRSGSNHKIFLLITISFCFATAKGFSLAAVNMTPPWKGFYCCCYQTVSRKLIALGFQNVFESLDNCLFS